MRNVFDQYTQNENRVTHALMVALDKDRSLLKSFLKNVLKINAPVSTRKLKVIEQRLPNATEPREEELDTLGLPDGWIYDDDGFCVVIESKIQSRLSPAQMRSHRRRAQNQGFDRINSVAILPHVPARALSRTKTIEWSSIYEWAHSPAAKSPWAVMLREYLEIAERKLLDQEKDLKGSLMTFPGFIFDEKNPYSYRKGKQLLGLAMTELRKNKDLQKRLGMKPSHPGRPSITGKGEARVWDYLSFAGKSSSTDHTKHPHLTLDVSVDQVEAMVTVPNGVGGEIRDRIGQDGKESFLELTSSILANMQPLLRECPVARPVFRGIQRRYPSQKSVPFVDARLEFDLRTAFKSKNGPKTQPIWLDAGYDAFSKRRGNFQIQFGVIFPYSIGKLKTKAAIKLIASSWLACKPIIDRVREV